MGIGNIAAAGSMSVIQMPLTNGKDQKSKNIQNKITDRQQQIQKLSSREELSAHEKATERKKLQKELSSLNTELKRHQEELRRSQKRERMLSGLQADKEPVKEVNQKDEPHTNDTAPDTAASQNPSAAGQQTGPSGPALTQSSDGSVILKEVLRPSKNLGADTENKPADDGKEEAIVAEETKPTDDDMITDTSQSDKDMHAMLSADSSLQQAGRQGTIIAKTEGGIAILKGEIKQDAYRGTDTERKQAELEKAEKQNQRAAAFQFSVLGEANTAMKRTTEAKASSNDQTRTVTENSADCNALQKSQEIQTAQQKFHVSIR